MPSEVPINIIDKMIFHLSKDRSPKDANLKSLEWAVITQVNGNRTVGQIGEILALEAEELQRIFKKLIGEGLLELSGVQGNSNTISQDFIKFLEKQYTLFVGPMATIIMNDTLGEMKLTREALDKDRLPYLVELLCLDISSEKKRLAFQKVVLKEFKNEL